MVCIWYGYGEGVGGRDVGLELTRMWYDFGGGFGVELVGMWCGVGRGWYGGGKNLGGNW